MIYRPTQIEQALIFLNKQFEKQKWVKIEAITEKKTLNQNNYIWLVFTVIAQDTGNMPKDIYQYYLEKFPTFKEIYINGENHSIVISLSGFSKEQTSVFIDRVVIDARQEGFIIPSPDDLEAINQYNYYKGKGIL